jgi:hypothetical protein
MRLRGTPDLGRVLTLPVALAALGLAGIVAWAAFPLGRAVGVTAVSALLFGVFQFGRGLRVLDRCRRHADDWLRTATGIVVPPAYAWRAAQLTSSRRRRMLARTLRLIEESARERPLGSHRPRLLAARRRRVSLEALAKTLESANEPVTPAGMLRVAELLSAGTGPLWGTSAEALGEEIETTLAVLTPRRLGSRDACAA